jgi:hypothetical protein
LNSQSNRGDFVMTTANTSIGRASLEGFYILETWIDPVTNGVYTLARARKGW